MTAKPAPVGDVPVTLDVSLLGRDYKVTCRENERAQLMNAVVFLDRRMREIRDTGKVAGSERIAVMAALNIAHDLLRARDEARAPGSQAAAPAIDDAAARRRIAAMHSAIDSALAERGKPA
jgi:cell division protein ZapA